MDTEDYVNSRDLKVDIFMSLAHFMHLQYDKAENIIKQMIYKEIRPTSYLNSNTPPLGWRSTINILFSFWN